MPWVRPWKNTKTPKKKKGTDYRTTRTSVQSRTQADTVRVPGVRALQARGCTHQHTHPVLAPAPGAPPAGCPQPPARTPFPPRPEEANVKTRCRVSPGNSCGSVGWRFCEVGKIPDHAKLALRLFPAYTQRWLTSPSTARALATERQRRRRRGATRTGGASLRRGPARSSRNALRAASGAFVTSSARAPAPSAQSRHGGGRSAAAGCGRGCSNGRDGPRHAAGRDPVRSTAGVPREGHPRPGGEEAAPVHQREDTEGDRWAPCGPPRTWRPGWGSGGEGREPRWGGGSWREWGAGPGSRGRSGESVRHSRVLLCVHFLRGLHRFSG